MNGGNIIMSGGDIPPSADKQAPTKPHQVYVMPEKFRQPITHPARKAMFFTIIAVVVLALLAVGGWWVWQKYFSPPTVKVTTEVTPTTPSSPLTPPAEEEIITTSTPPLLVPTTTPSLATSTPPATATSTPETTATSTIDVVMFADLLSSLDSDNDGLTDVEEVVFGTNATSTDSDNDGYSDLVELTNGYDPTKGDRAKLADSQLFTTYSNQDFAYIFNYPSAWTFGKLADDNSQVIFSYNTGEFVEVSVYNSNPDKLSAHDWYLERLEGAVPEEELATISLGDLTGVWSVDGAAVYLTKRVAGVNEARPVYLLFYNFGLKEELNFKATFQLMLNSFKLSPAS